MSFAFSFQHAVITLLFTDTPLSTSVFPCGSTKAAFTTFVRCGYGVSIRCLELGDTCSIWRMQTTHSQVPLLRTREDLACVAGVQRGGRGELNSSAKCEESAKRDR